MKTTELIKQLSALVAEHGDLEVRRWDYDETAAIDEAQVHTEVLSEKPDFFLVW